MTETKFCDLHDKDDQSRKVPKESVQQVVVEKWMRIQGSNVLFENRLDSCEQHIISQIMDRAKGLGVNIEKNWKTTVWKTNKAGKKYKAMMSMDEYMLYLEERKREEELKELKELRVQQMSR